jgi:hypothetical protein
MSSIDHLSTTMRRFGDRRVLVASGALCFVLAAVMFGTSGTGSLAQVAERCGQAAPDVRFTSSPEQVQGFLTACGAAGREAYRDLQLLDLVYPAAVGTFLAAALASVLSRAARRTRVVALAALPLLASGFDYLENLAAWVLLARYPDPLPWVARLLGLASAGKQSLMWASITILAVGIVVAVGGRLRRGRTLDQPAAAGPTGAGALTSR